MGYLNSRLAQITGQRELFRHSDHKIPVFGFSGVQHLIENTGEGQIDTGRMMKALLEKTREAGVEVITGISIDSFEEDTHHILLKTGSNTIRAGRLLLATNGFARHLLPEAPVKPGRAQVLITRPIPGLRIQGTFHYDKGYYYFRNIGDRLLLGGGRNLDFQAEETTEFGLTALVQDSLDKLLRDVILPGTDYEVDMRWSGIMGLGDRKSTIVKALSGRLFCAVRMGGMGVAIGSLIGEEAAELVLKEC
jgi:gamma-glutamylputrescine oxidase